MSKNKGQNDGKKKRGGDVHIGQSTAKRDKIEARRRQRNDDNFGASNSQDSTAN